ncbi:MAG: TetR/AcrR family transcriptional regulator [Bacteroidales bacterium]|jgi:AcrR family transcriptional regulator|nr:TetR/AcrR family transcriptional regulator [Bacteroidales bacterium]
MVSNRNKILETAIKSIATKGFDAVSIRSITRDVGIKESSFYNHFKSKQALLDEIFELMEKDLNRIRPEKSEIEQLCHAMTLKEFLTKRLNQFLKGWENPMARYLWFVVSQQQYKNRKAAALIVQETERSVEMFHTAFKVFMQQGKMKNGDAFFLGNLYGYSIRAIHLDCTYRQFESGNEKNTFKRMYDIMEKFAEEYSA